jgi:putative colanic acid biosynthesis UDP-glucose lipid carrier transferase
MSESSQRKPLANLRGALSAARAIEVFIHPLVVIAWLLTMSASFGQPLDARLVVSVVLAFALSYPGNIALTDQATALLSKCLLTSFTVLAGLALFAFASHWMEGVDRDSLLLWFSALPFLLIVVHLSLRFALPWLMSVTHSQATVVVCGVNDIGAELAAQFEVNPYHGVRFVGFFDDRKRDRLSRIGNRALLGGFDDLGKFVRTHRVERIYMALPMATQPRIVKMLEDLKDSTASVYFVPDMFVTEVINGRFESVAGMPVVAVRDTPFASVFNSALKRLEDLVLASVVLVLTAPLLIAIVAGVRLTSPGPALFRQRRYGLDGRDIVVYKFRTMTVAEDGARQFTAVTKGDSRVTRFGNFLRRTSLDELPQVINVLQGRMSLVGPRPHVVAMNEQFRKLIPGYMLRHKVKPGITGLAQIRGFRGGDNLDEMSKRISSDLEYLRNWTLGMDLWILAQTALRVWRDSKAY